MKQYIYACLCFLFFLWGTSCNEDSSSLVPVGTLRLNVDKDNALSTKGVNEATDEMLSIYIINTDGDTIKTYNNYLEEVRNENLLLPVGSYNVSVCSNQTEEAGWEKPLYTGKKSVEIKQGEITSASITCSITNTKVSVSFTEDVKNIFVDYTTTVSNSSGSLVFVRDEYRAGFFTPEKLIAELKLIRKKDGQEFNVRRVFPDIEPRFHYTLSFRMAKPSEGEAGGDFNITVDKDAERVDCEIVIDESTLEGEAIPAYKLSESFQDNKIILKEDQNVPEASLIIDSEVGLESLVLKVGSELFQSEGLTSFNLLDLDDATKAKLEGLKFPIPANQDSYNKISFDFDELMDFLLEKIKLELDTKIHTFTLYAMDKLHQETVLTITFDVSPKLPAKTVKANAFAKYVYLYGESSESTGLGFKYKIEGDSEYKTIEVPNPNPDGSFSALVTNLQPGKTYMYYAIAGTDLKGAEKTFVTEKENPLTNGGFEIENDNPWSKNSSFWGCGNNTVTSSLASATDKVPSSSIGNKAAYLKATSSMDILAAGNTFTGTFAFYLLDANGIVSVGRSFNSRPSKFEGMYKYKPGTVNSKEKTVTLPNGTVVDATGTDKCALYIVLTTEPFDLNPKDPSNLFDLSSEKFKKIVVAFGEIQSNEETNGDDYHKFSIDIEYKLSDVRPAYIGIVCSTCKYGDYFVGSSDSQMWLDDFELIYDDAPNN